MELLVRAELFKRIFNTSKKQKSLSFFLHTHSRYNIFLPGRLPKINLNIPWGSPAVVGEEEGAE